MIYELRITNYEFGMTNWFEGTEDGEFTDTVAPSYMEKAQRYTELVLGMMNFDLRMVN